MSIKNLVNYDQTIDFKLLHPSTQEEIGVVFKLRGMNNSESKRALYRKNLREEQARTGRKKYSVEDAIEDNVKVLVPCFVGWDWNGNDYNDGDGGLEFTPSNVAEVLTEDWIYEQVVTEVNKIENFIKS